MGRELLQKVQIVQASQTALPNCCVVCTNFKDEFVDIGLDVEFYGVVYLCKLCFNAVGLLVGLIPAEELDVANKKIQHQDHVIEELEQRVETYESVLDGLNVLRSRSAFDDPIESGSLASSTQDSEGTDKLPPGIIGGGTLEVSGSTKSSDVKGHRGLRDDDGLADLIDSI